MIPERLRPRQLLQLALRERITFTPIAGDDGARDPDRIRSVARLSRARMEVGMSRVGLASPSGVAHVWTSAPICRLRAA